MEIINLEHHYGTTADQNTNIGLLTMSSTAGEISCSWRSATHGAGGQAEGSAVFRASSPLYRSDNTAASGAMTIPLNRVDATFALIVFLNNSNVDASARLSAAVGNHEGSTTPPTEVAANIGPGDSASFCVAFIAR